MYQEYFGETQRILRQTVHRFVEREVLPYVQEWEDKEEFPRELYKRAGELGILGLGYPEHLGGTPADIFAKIAVIEELVGSGSLGFYIGLTSHQIAIPPILAMGTEEQKERFVPPVFTGEKIAALAITEPDAGSDVASIRTRAVRVGDEYIVNGAKTFITSGCRADLVTTAVRTGGEGYGGLSLLVIETNTPGFKVANKLRKMGWHASDTAELVFEDCRVPAANLLGKEGQGFYGIMGNFGWERVQLAVAAHHVAQIAYEASLRYAQTRNAFGKPLTGFQVTRHKLADMATKIAAAREFNYRVAALLEAGKDVRVEVAMAKNFACEVCDRVVYDAVQIHGGYGYAREYLVERLYRDSRILSIGGGTTEIMKEIISKTLKI